MTPVHISPDALGALLGDWRGAGSTAAYAGLAERIRLLLLDGRLGDAVRLPAERELARSLGVSRNTVTHAYDELRRTGFVSSRQGSGSVTRLPGPQPDPEALRYLEFGRLDFAKATWPAVPGFHDACRHALEMLPAYLGGSGYDPVGIPPLREAVARRYTERGIPTHPDQILVTLGAQHAIGLIGHALLRRRERVAIDQPTYPHAIDGFRAAGARLIGLPVSAHAGWDPAGLDTVFHDARPALAYLIPDFQNPTGASMPAAVRERLTAAARRSGTLLVADETTAELDIDRVGDFPSLAQLGDAVLIGSTGKTLWGGLRVGWIRTTPQRVEALVRARHAWDLGTPILEQLVVARLLEDFDAVLDHRRAQLRRGRATTTALLARHLPEWQVPAVHGGLALWVGLGRPVSSRLTLLARDAGMALIAGPRFGLGGTFERHLRIPLTLDEGQARAGIEVLARAWRTLAVTGPDASRASLGDAGRPGEVI